MKRLFAGAILVLFLIPIPLLNAANLLVPSFELITYGYLEGGSFNLRTRGDIDFRIEGGYKFGGSIVLGFQNDALENIFTDTEESADNTLTFKAANILVREIFALPLNLTYFTGESDIFCNGDTFVERFGSDSFASKYRGYVYFPNSTVYDGIHTILGTGFAVDTGTLWEKALLSLYLYQDGYLGQGKYSTDLRGLLNYTNFKLEAFLGATFGANTYGIYRGGLLLYYKAGATGEFLTQVGIPRWDVDTDTFNIGLFYFLFEPRVNLDKMSIIMTLFWHPEYYLQTETEELGSIDINIDFRFGESETSELSGGVESNLAFSTAVTETETDQFRARISPYMSVISSGVIWDFKVQAKVFPFDLSDIVEAFIGVRAEF